MCCDDAVELTYEEMRYRFFHRKLKKARGDLSRYQSFKPREITGHGYYQGQIDEMIARSSEEVSFYSDVVNILKEVDGIDGVDKSN